MRTIALFALLSLLSACATPSRQPMHPVEGPAPIAPDPRLCVPAKPEPPVQGSIVQPATDEERAATGAFLTGEAAARDWGREGWGLAEIARKGCPQGPDRRALPSALRRRRPADSVPPLPRPGGCQHREPRQLRLAGLFAVWA